MRSTLCVIFVLFYQATLAQVNTISTGAIKGVLIDKKTKEPIPGVNVIADDGHTKQGAATEVNGDFIISNLSSGTYTLVLSSIGYSQKRIEGIALEKSTVKDIGSINLEESAITLNEVTVTPGSFSVMGAAPVAQQTLTEKDLKNMSWAEDITRAVSRLPGVSSTDFSSKFTVRGGEADEVLMTLDGMELYEPFHQRDFVGGLFSIVDIETIQGIDLMTGGFGAEFGQRQSGVFQMKTKSIPDNQRKTSVGLSMVNARLYTEGKYASNKGSYLFSARRGMLDLLFKGVGKTETLPSFYDVMGKVEYKLNSKNILSFHALHAGDKNSIRDEKSDNYDRHDTRYTNDYGWLTLKSAFTPKLNARTLLYSGLITHHRVGLFHKRDYADKGDFSLLDKRSYSFFGLKSDLTWDVSDRFAMKAGFDVRQLNADYDYSQSITEIRVNQNDSLYTFSRAFDVKAKPSGQLINLYTSGRFMVARNLFLESGIRYDVATYSNDKVWSPRVSVAYAFSKTTFLRCAWGRYYQSQFINNLDVNHNGTAFNPAELSTHYVLGFEHLFKKGVSLRVETYYKDISRISSIYQNLRDPWETFPESRNDVVKLNLKNASAKGIEIFMKYDLGKKISWWFSYAMARAEDKINNIEFDGLFIEKTDKQLRPNNQFHTIYADVNYRMKKEWHFSLSWQFYKGWPRTTYTYVSQKLPDTNLLGQETLAIIPNGNLQFYQKHEEFNGVQYPAYHRMDFRINRHFQMLNSRVSIFLHVINVYNHFNLRKFDLGVTDDNGALIPDGKGGYVSTVDNTHWFGLLPVVGASWEF